MKKETPRAVAGATQQDGEAVPRSGRHGVLRVNARYLGALGALHSRSTSRGTCAQRDPISDMGREVSRKAGETRF